MFPVSLKWRSTTLDQAPSAKEIHANFQQQQSSSVKMWCFECFATPSPDVRLPAAADLLADLSASQILAQADLPECNSPLKIVQIGGDDLFENDETGANDYLLDTEVGMS